jgi:hypothetical protein
MMAEPVRLSVIRRRKSCKEHVCNG